MLSESTSNKIIQLARDAELEKDLKDGINSLLYLMMNEWGDRLRERNPASADPQSQEGLEAKVVETLDSLETLRGDSHENDRSPALEEVRTAIARIDQIRSSKEIFPVSPNLLFWEAQVDAEEGLKEIAVEKITKSLQIIADGEAKGKCGTQITASKVLRLKTISKIKLSMGDVDGALAAAFQARDFAHKVSGEEDLTQIVRQYFLTHRFAADPIATAYFCICHAYVEGYDLGSDSERETEFVRYWDHFALSGGIDKLSPIDMFAFLSSDQWRQVKPDMMSTSAAALHLKLSSGAIQKAFRRTGLTLAAINSLRKGSAGNVPYDQKWAASIVLPIFAAGAGAAYFMGADPVEFVNWLISEAKIEEKDAEEIGNAMNYIVPESEAQVADMDVAAKTLADSFELWSDFSDYQYSGMSFSNGDTSGDLT